MSRSVLGKRGVAVGRPQLTRLLEAVEEHVLTLAAGEVHLHINTSPRSSVHKGHSAMKQIH